jgi:hypothetical protein
VPARHHSRCALPAVVVTAGAAAVHLNNEGVCRLSIAIAGPGESQASMKLRIEGHADPAGARRGTWACRSAGPKL